MEGSQCTRIACDEASRSCTEVPANEGASCEDGLFCTVGDSCADGVCEAGEPNDCGLEPTECASVACDETARACAFLPENEGNPCDDGLFCTVGDTCTAGECLPRGQNDCGLTGTECSGVSCSEQGKSCSLVAIHEGQACGSGTDLCQPDLCVAGACIGVPRDCSTADSVCGTGVCNPANGACETRPVSPGTACELNGGCATGSCTAGGSCQAAPVADGSACSPSTRCPGDGLCLEGACYESDGCRTYLSEDFSSCPGNWVARGDWACGVPTSGPDSPFSSPNVFATNLDGNYGSSRLAGDNYLQTPTIDLSNAVDPELLLWAWMSTENGWDGWNVKVSSDGGETFTVAGASYPPYSTLNSNNLGDPEEPGWTGDRSQDGWRPFRVDLSPWARSQIIVRFDFRSDASVVRAGIYLDDVQIVERAVSPLDILPVEESIPFIGTPWSQQMVRLGGSEDAIWTVEGGSNHSWLSVDPASGEIAGTPGPTDMGRGHVLVRVSEPSAPWNYAETEVPFIVTPAPVFIDGFEDCVGWTFGPVERTASDWHCGAPGGSSGPGKAYGGLNVIATNLSGSHGNNMDFATHYARSPTISLAGAAEPKLTFWGWSHTEANHDGMNVSVSADGGETFALATSVTPPYDTLSNGAGLAWAGNRSSQGWTQYQVDLSPWIGHQIQLQFGFRSDGTVTNPGFYVDDVRISNGPGIPLRIVTDALLDGYVGAEYTRLLTRVGGSTAARWSIVGGSNHEWLIVDPVSGRLSGIPQTMGPVAVSVRLAEPDAPWNHDERTYRFNVGPASWFFEGFEDCSRWTFGPATRGSADWDCGVPTSGPNGSTEGRQVLATGLTGNYGNNMRPETHFAQTPTIDLRRATEPLLTFDMWFHTEANWDGLTIDVSADGGVTYQTAQPLYPAYFAVGGSSVNMPGWTGDSRTWRRFDVDLSPWAGQQILVRFGIHSDGSLQNPGFYVDNLRIADASQVQMRLPYELHTLKPLIGAPFVSPTVRSGGSSATRWRLLSTGHDWLSIDPVTGTLTGAPTTPGPVEVTFRAEDPGASWNFVEETITLEVRTGIFSEDFATCPGGWTLVGGWECGAATSGPQAALTGSNVLATILDGNYTTSVEWGNWTATGPLLPGAATAGGQLFVQLRAWVMTESCCDGFNVMVSVDGGATFALAPAAHPAYGSSIGTPSRGAWRSSTGEWTTYTADLSAWAGQDLILRFDFRSDSSTVGPGVYINDVSVYR